MDELRRKQLRQHRMLKKRRRRRISIFLLTVSFVAALFFTGYVGMRLELLAKEEPQQQAGEVEGQKPELKALNVTEALIGYHHLLVNQEHLLSEAVWLQNAILTDLAEAAGRIPLEQDGIILNKTALTAAESWLEEGRQRGYDKLYVTSGYRTADKQQELYEGMADKSYVQQPGASEHQTGLSLDIAAKGIKSSQLANCSEGRWLFESSWRYGFITRYPEDKTAITGISFEPWHFRYVGLPHAYVCHQEGLCFEEYIDYLKVSGGYEINLLGRDYFVYYSDGGNAIINVPEAMDYEISIDNTGGYIVTAVR